MRTRESQSARKRPWLDRAGEDRAPPIAGAGCGGAGGEYEPRAPPKCSVFSRHPKSLARRSLSRATCAADILRETPSAGEGLGKAGGGRCRLTGKIRQCLAVSLLFRGPRKPLQLAGEQTVINSRLFWSWAPAELSDSVVHPPPIWQTWGGSAAAGLIRRREGQATPVFLPGGSHGQRSLAGYTVHGVAESDTTE